MTLPPVGGAVGTGVLTGSLDDLTSDEVEFVRELLALGHDVEVVATGRQRTPDFRIDGVATELKMLSGVTSLTADGLSAALSSRILDARGQAADVVVDARRQPGMASEIADRGIRRAMSADIRLGSKLRSVKVLTADGTVEARRH